MPQAKVKHDELRLKTRKIVKKLKDYYGEVECYLTHKNAFELICAVALSAQCTDERVNLTTPSLFKKYPDAFAMAKAKLPELEKIVKPCGFYRNKARNLKNMAIKIVNEFQGEVPNNMDDLVTLAGVGRKTANVVLGNWFHDSAGVVVDTHVKRITNLLGLTKNKEPEKIEQDLNKIVPKKYWDQFSLWLIAHGRETCIARRPQCDKCMFNKLCENSK